MKSILSYVISFLLLNQTAMAGMGEMKQLKTASLPQQLATVYTMNYIDNLEKAIQGYNKSRLSFDYYTKLGKRLNKADSKYLLEILENTKNVQLPKIKLKNEKYVIHFQGRTIHFTPLDTFRNNIYINGKAFHIDPTRSLAKLTLELQSFLSKKTSSSSIPALLLKIFLIPEAKAGFMDKILEVKDGVIDMVSYLLALLATALFDAGLFADKTQVAKKTLDELNQSLEQETESCKSAKRTDVAYDRTYNIMSKMMGQDSTGDHFAVRFYRNIYASITGKSAHACNTIIEQFASAVSPYNPETFNSIKEKLCGKSRVSQGSYGGLQKCMAGFYNTHKSVTAHNPDQETDGGTRMIKSRSYYNGDDGARR